MPDLEHRTGVPEPGQISAEQTTAPDSSAREDQSAGVGETTESVRPREASAEQQETGAEREVEASRAEIAAIPERKAQPQGRRPETVSAPAPTAIKKPGFIRRLFEPLMRWKNERVAKFNAKRTKNMADILDPYLPDGSVKNSEVLDLGCGDGLVIEEQVRRLQAKGRSDFMVHAIDVQNFFRAEEGPNLKFEQYDGEHLSLADGTVDTSYLTFVLHHSHNPEAVIDECIRVTKEGGRIVVTEDIFENFWEHVKLVAADLTNKIISTKMPTPLKFRREKAWRELFESLGLKIANGRGIGERVFPRGKGVGTKKHTLFELVVTDEAKQRWQERHPANK